MSRVTATTVIAEVVDLFLARDIPIEVGVDHQMNGHSLAIEAHPAITTTSAFAGVGAFPQEAGGGLIVQYEACVGHGNTSQDTLDDPIASVVQLIGVNIQRGGKCH